MKIDPQILRIISDATLDGHKLKLAPEQLDRKVYQAVAKVIEAAGGRWDRYAKAHVFEHDPADTIESVLLTGEIMNRKQEFGQFDTPPDLADQVVDFAEIKPGMKVYEPSAGIGNLVAAIIEELGGGANIFGNEIDPNRHAICRERCFSAFGAGGLSMEDFLKIDPNPVFDRVVMNSPFARRADILHVTHATKFLRPGGRLVAIMSGGVSFRRDRATLAFRDLVQISGGTIEPLPDDSFKASGTSVNTVLVSFNG